MITTQTYWDINGIPLQTMAWNVTTWGGSLQAPPPSRGRDVVVSGVPGQRAMPRTPDARILTFKMWVLGADEDGLPPVDAEARDFFERNWRMLRKTFWNQTKEFVLTRRWIDDNGVLHAASAIARYDSGLDLSMTGTLRADFTVDVLLADPFFVEEPKQKAISATGGAVASLNNEGDFPTTHLVLTLQGPIPAGAQVSIGTTSLIIDTAIASDRYVRIDNKARTAYLHTTPGGVFVDNFISEISFIGGWGWLAAYPGTFAMEYNGTTDTGTITLDYSALYL